MIHEETPTKFTVSVPFPTDISLNPWGDYQRLEKTIERAEAKPESVTKTTWRLAGEVHGNVTSKELTEDEVRIALEAVFFYLAYR